MQTVEEWFLKTSERRKEAEEQRKSRFALIGRTEKKKYSRFKIIQCGHVLEVFCYQHLPGQKKDNTEVLETIKRLNFGQPKQLEINWEVGEDQGQTETPPLKEDRTEENKKQSLYRTRKAVQRLALCNFKPKDIFMTVTFKENIDDVNYANNEFKKFMKRLRYKFKENIKYLAVIEFQERGAIHFHCLLKSSQLSSSLKWDEWTGERYVKSKNKVVMVRPSVEKAENFLSSIWGHGWVDLDDINGVDNLGSYLIKYMSKDLADKRLGGHKRYLMSKGLAKPIKVNQEETGAFLDVLEDFYPVYTSEYKTEWNGNIKFLEYNLERV